MDDRPTFNPHPFTYAPEEQVLGGQLGWRRLDEAIDEVVALGLGVTSGCADCELKCCTYLVRVLNDEIPGLSETAERMGLGITEVLLPPGNREFPGSLTLRHEDDGDTCLFFGPEGGCRIHAEIGPRAKPMACQIYPAEPVVTPRGARMSLRAECTRPGVTEDPRAAEELARVLRRRAEMRPPMYVRSAPEAVRLDGAREIPWADYEAWEQELVAAVRGADVVMDALDGGIAALVEGFDLRRPRVEAGQVETLAGGLYGLYEEMELPGEAAALHAIACGDPPRDPRPAPPALVAAAIEGLALLRFRTLVAGLGVLRLGVAMIDRHPWAGDRPLEAAAHVMRKLNTRRVSLTLGRAEARRLAALAFHEGL